MRKARRKESLGFTQGTEAPRNLLRQASPSDLNDYSSGDNIHILVLVEEKAFFWSAKTI